MSVSALPTRGKRLVVLVGSKRALAIAVKNDSIEERCMRLAERLRAGGFQRGVGDSCLQAADARRWLRSRPR